MTSHTAPMVPSSDSTTRFAGVVDGGLVGVDFGILDLPVQQPPQQRKPEHHISG